ncbi:putative phospholipase B-like 2 [Haliotis cracherodii]|uniref:putative phospholipase B-like 2 n=1 Tax=Haliotis cracherodii TaxID=6455 RepID=UPI0039EC8C13
MAAAYQFTLVVVLLSFLSTTLSLRDNDPKTVYVILDDATQTFKFSENVENKYVVSANYVDSMNATGWSFLDIAASSDVAYNDSVRAYAAGLAESYLTRESINLQWQNTIAGYCEKPYSDYCQRLQGFLNANLLWVKEQIRQNRNNPYWHHVALFYEQLAGLQDGYSKSVRQVNMDIELFGLYAFQYSGDLEDLEEVLHKPVPRRILGSGSCSALVKVLPGNEEIYVAQDTWTSFQNMLRILKRYKLGFTASGHQDVLAPGDTMTFSSYPGSIMSGDDYYHLSSDMVSMETTIGNSNNDLWKYVTPQSVLEGVRSLVANRLATSGVEWAYYFSQENSGTYNNMWMIVDMKRFSPKSQSLNSGLLTVLEQIPNMIKYADLTSLLEKKGYFASYNVAYFPEIFNASGGPENVKKYGDWFSYDHTARANIFRRDHSKVKDIDSMMKLMRYNDFTHDPLSRCNCTPPYSGENAISARSDLNPKNGKYPFSSLGHRSHGGIDAKITSYSNFMQLEKTFIAVAGPTYDQLPPFQWSKADFASECPHYGHPDLFRFTPMMYNGTIPDLKWTAP